MSTRPPFPFDDLPIELQREVFLIAATYERGSAIRLVHVARKVHAWLQPCICDLVTLGANDTALFLRTMDTTPGHFFASSVKKLCLSVSVKGRNAERILAACTGVTDLAFWVDYLSTVPNRSIAPLISPLPLRRLSIELEHFNSLFSSSKLRHVWSDHLTHLDIIFWTHELSPVVPHLDQLPSLTHLALRLRHNHVHEDALFNILLARKNLKVLVIFDESDTTEESVWPVDPRVVYMPYPDNVICEWEAQARQDDVCSWSRAENAIRKHIAERQRASPTSA